MRLTKQSSYAVRALMYCAIHNEKLSRVSDIAKTYSISELFLFKIIRPLVDDGIIETTRGRNGGIKLAKPANEISLLHAIRLTEDKFELVDTGDDSDPDQQESEVDEFNRVLNEALTSFFDALDNYTIGDLVGDRLQGLSASSSADSEKR